jgi:6-phospho-beta-glucosidase
MEIETELFKIYADPQSREKPALLARRGGANYSLAALRLIEAIHGDRGETQILNVLNQGTIPVLPPSAAIEVPCRVDRNGARPLPLSPPPPSIMGLIQAVKAYETLVIEAAAEQSYGKALLALTAHPLGPEVDQAEKVLDDIIATHEIKYLAR